MFNCLFLLPHNSVYLRGLMIVRQASDLKTSLFQLLKMIFDLMQNSAAVCAVPSYLLV